MRPRIALPLACTAILSSCIATGVDEQGQPTYQASTLELNPTSGYRGIQIELTGAGVTRAEKVVFENGSTDSNPQIHPVKPDTITATVPQSAQSGFVTVIPKQYTHAQFTIPEMVTLKPFQVLTGTADDGFYTRPFPGLLLQAPAVPVGLAPVGEVSSDLPDWWKLEIPTDGAWAHTHEFTISNQGTDTVSDEILVSLHGTLPSPIESVSVPGGKKRRLWITVLRDSSAPLRIQVSTSTGTDVPYQVDIVRTPLNDVYEDNNQIHTVRADPARFTLADEQVVEAYLAPSVDLKTGQNKGFKDHYLIPPISQCAVLGVFFTGLYEEYPGVHQLGLTLIAPEDSKLPDEPFVLGGSISTPTVNFVKDFPDGGKDWAFRVSLVNAIGNTAPAPPSHGRGRAPGYALSRCLIMVESDNRALVDNPAYPDCK